MSKDKTMLGRYFPFFWMLFFVVSASWAQSHSLSPIFIKNSNLVYQDPEQVRKVASYLEHSNTPQSKAEGLYLLSESNFVLGNYSESIARLFETNQLLKADEGAALKVFVLASISSRCRIFGVQDKSDAYLDRASGLLNGLAKGTEKNGCHATVLLNQAYILLLNQAYILLHNQA
ncbi:hypothetical protein [Flavobacterium caeni]|nr:hypothetical protein [Flavobacterium caeni]